MRLGLVLCLAVLAAAAPAAAENWQPVPGDSGTYFDKDFLRVDEASGLIVLRYAQGKAQGAGYKDWPAGKSPVMMYALDCMSDAWMDLGLDFDGKAGLPEGWRDMPKETGIELGVGAAGKDACDRQGDLPKVALP